jgi:hypothetical protein
VGMNYILIAFAYDFVPPSMYRGHGPHGFGRLIQYAPSAVMCVAAPLLVLVADAHRRLEIRYRRAGLGPLVN